MKFIIIKFYSKTIFKQNWKQIKFIWNKYFLVLIIIRAKKYLLKK